MTHIYSYHYSSCLPILQMLTQPHSGNSQGQPQRYLDLDQCSSLASSFSSFSNWNGSNSQYCFVFQLCDAVTLGSVLFYIWIRSNFSTVFKHVIVSWDVHLLIFKEFRSNFFTRPTYHSLVSVWCIRLVLLIFLTLCGFISFFIFFFQVFLL